jgi:hypothetical protein
MNKLLGSLEAHIAEIATTGKLARLQVEQERSALERAKDWMAERWPS